MIWRIYRRYDLVQRKINGALWLAISLKSSGLIPIYNSVMSLSSVANEIKVSAQSVYLSDYSKPESREYLFCYKITIKNEGDLPAQLLSRHWIIIDSESHREEVVGDGVVGKQPKLQPGESYTYFSFCNLRTNFGTMEGSYHFVDDEGHEFSAKIPRFFLSDNLNEFETNQFQRGAIVRHKKEDYLAVIADFDMYFLNDEKLYEQDSSEPDKEKPWYYLLIDNKKTISYVAQEQLELVEEAKEIKHPLVEFFFDGFDGETYKRNQRTWQDLKII